MHLFSTLYSFATACVLFARARTINILFSFKIYFYVWKIFHRINNNLEDLPKHYIYFGRSAKTLHIFWKICQNSVYILADLPKFIHCFGRSSKILFSLFNFREEKWFDWLLLFSFIFHAVCTLTLTHSLLSSTRFHQ